MWEWFRYYLGFTGDYWAYYVKFGLLGFTGIIMCNLDYWVLLVLLFAIWIIGFYWYYYLQFGLLGFTGIIMCNRNQCVSLRYV